MSSGSASGCRLTPRRITTRPSPLGHTPGSSLFGKQSLTRQRVEAGLLPQPASTLGIGTIEVHPQRPRGRSAIPNAVPPDLSASTFAIQHISADQAAPVAHDETTSSMIAFNSFLTWRASSPSSGRPEPAKTDRGLSVASFSMSADSYTASILCLLVEPARCRLQSALPPKSRSPFWPGTSTAHERWFRHPGACAPRNGPSLPFIGRYSNGAVLALSWLTKACRLSRVPRRHDVENLRDDPSQ